MYDPSGHGKLLFARFSMPAETERNNIRESALTGARRRRPQGQARRLAVITEDML
ncbi:hypothetical protein ACWEWG_00235 [Streptomyces sp. NPDC003758]|uniref:Uncharacterized protein n=1 Tax=Streptomyces cynarae TaxID=2981134 RepID=A0ABY6DXA5_9ACTN|nr:hypothetical protein [Streptomyces cynarae]UXY17661.1 hypothetical protein N8I84_02000 [Streptomyces cynarae]